MDRDEVARGVTETLHDFSTYGDEARLDDCMPLFCEDAVFDPGRPFRDPR
jgi:hypothetical protein